MSYWLKLTGMLLVAFAVAIFAVHSRDTSARGRLARIRVWMSPIEVQAVMGRHADLSVDWNKVAAHGPVRGNSQDTWNFADRWQLTVAYDKNRGVVHKELEQNPNLLIADP
jgi:hypothetical protein